jgi:alkylated DNA nucleotide flippase Atl1
VNQFTEAVSDQNRAPYAVLARLLQGALRAVGKLRQRTSTGYDRGLLLERVITDLENLNRRTEQDFLGIGGKLMGFVTGARQLSADMAALETIFGTQDRHASEVLNRVLERSKQIEARAEAGHQALAGVCDSARQIGRTFRGFQDTVSNFRVLGSLTRIETARLGNAGQEFGHLAEEVSTLTESIESSGQGILDVSSALHQNMQLALTKVTGLRTRELAELPSLIADVMNGLESLEDRHRRAVEVFLQQAAEYRQVSAAFEDLITAIQFHDITRQQIEHVADALRRLRAEWQEGCRDRSSARLDARAVLALQASQLSHAEGVFTSSAGRIEQDLDGIAGRVRNMAETSLTLMGHSANAQDSFFAQMEARFTAIFKVLGTCVEAEGETQGVLAELEETVGRMRDSVAQIRLIEIRIHRTAINATIRAVQIGDAGSALNVLAGVMQRVALDSSSITDKITGDLDAISDTANGLSGGSGGTEAGKESGTDRVLPEMRTAMLELQSSSEASFSRLNQITPLSRQLGDEIQSVRAGFSAGTLFAEAIQRARSTLEEIGGQAGHAAADEEIAARARLEDLATHYTMQAEREVHSSVMTGVANQAAPAEAAEPAGGENLGDNVELF